MPRYRLIEDSWCLWAVQKRAKFLWWQFWRTVADFEDKDDAIEFMQIEMRNDLADVKCMGVTVEGRRWGCYS